MCTKTADVTVDDSSTDADKRMCDIRHKTDKGSLDSLIEQTRISLYGEAMDVLLGRQHNESLAKNRPAGQLLMTL